METTPFSKGLHGAGSLSAMVLALSSLSCWLALLLFQSTVARLDPGGPSPAASQRRRWAGAAPAAMPGRPRRSPAPCEPPRRCQRAGAPRGAGSEGRDGGGMTERRRKCTRARRLPATAATPAGSAAGGTGNGGGAAAAAAGAAHTAGSGAGAGHGITGTGARHTGIGSNGAGAGHGTGHLGRALGAPEHGTRGTGARHSVHRGQRGGRWARHNGNRGTAHGHREQWGGRWAQHTGNRGTAQQALGTGAGTGHGTLGAGARHTEHRAASSKNRMAAPELGTGEGQWRVEVVLGTEHPTGTGHRGHSRDWHRCWVQGSPRVAPARYR
ncbi:uncharacterized protein LOC141730999 [Zonotrichia albicollis]|uniref:uncharacterized protein LOC141730999 n=1 Tax=Zonotrichia albicollis TaxID=44394 RepID=UPI003D80C933